MLDLQEVTTSSIRIFLDHDTVARLEPRGLYEIVRVRLIRAPAVTRIGFDFGFFGLSIPNESETFPLGREER